MLSHISSPHPAERQSAGELRQQCPHPHPTPCGVEQGVGKERGRDLRASQRWSVLASAELTLGAK